MAAKRYRIVVKGRLSDRFRSVFGAVELQSQPGHTALVGDFESERELDGVLDRLGDFGIDVVSVSADD